MDICGGHLAFINLEQSLYYYLRNYETWILRQPVAEE